MYKNYQYELFSTSWGVHEGFKTAVDRLNDLIPIDGKCEYSQSKNKNLEKFRKAQNAMYDLFNNGLGNKKNEFRNIFGFTYSKTYEWNKTQWFYVEEIMETHFNPIIQNAIKEQGVI